MIEIAIFQVGKKYGWALREILPDFPLLPETRKTIREGACQTFREASVEAETALLLHGRKETLAVVRWENGYTFRCSCGRFGWSYRRPERCECGVTA